VVALRVLLPVDEVLARPDLQRIRKDARAAVRRRAQAHHLRAEVDRAVVAVMRDVLQCDMNRHGVLLRARAIAARGKTCATAIDRDQRGHGRGGQDRQKTTQGQDRMTFMPWTQALEVGIAEIDEQHRWLVEQTNALYQALQGEAPREQVGALLEGLMDYVMNHFIVE